MKDIEILDNGKGIVRLGNIIRKRLRKDFDFVCAITGEQEGIGKTTLAYHLAKAIDPKFNFKRNMAFLPDYQEIEVMFKDMPQYSCLVIDEAIKSLHKHKWAERFQQRIIEMYATERYQNKATIVVIPRFKDLTENFRNHKVHLWIHVLTRGLAVVYKKIYDKDLTDIWLLEQNIKRKELFLKTNSNVSLSKRLDLERSSKNYLMEIRFPDLSEEVKLEYQTLKVESRNKVKSLKQLEDEKKEGTFNKQNKERLRLAIRELLNKGMMAKDIQKCLNIPSATYKLLLRDKEQLNYSNNRENSEKKLVIDAPALKLPKGKQDLKEDGQMV